MCLLTAHGISFTFYTGTYLNPFQGLIQGNGVASPGFLIIVVLLIRSSCNKNLIPPSTSPIFKVIYYLAGQIFINNSDFNIMNTGDEAEAIIVNRAQQVLTT